MERSRSPVGWPEHGECSDNPAGEGKRISWQEKTVWAHECVSHHGKWYYPVIHPDQQLLYWGKSRGASLYSLELAFSVSLVWSPNFFWSVSSWVVMNWRQVSSACLQVLWYYCRCVDECHAAPYILLSNYCFVSTSDSVFCTVRTTSILGGSQFKSDRLAQGAPQRAETWSRQSAGACFFLNI